VKREFREGLGEPVEWERLVWLVENFFSIAGKERHEAGLYFVARLQPGSRILQSSGPFVGAEGYRSLTFAWFDRPGLDQVDVRPSFLAGALASQELPFRHVVHRVPQTQ
jgi:hypothetical protein